MHNRNGLHRVVITGAGIVSPVGTGIEGFWAGVRGGRVGVRKITRFDPSPYASQIAAEVDDFEPGAYLSPKRLRWTERFAQFSIAAAKLALQDAAFAVNGNGGETGVFVGSALGGLAYAEDQSEVFRQKGIDAVRPLLAISVFGGASISNISLEFGFHGPNVANANSCASGAVAIGQAYQAVARGDARAALAGGVEAPLSPLLYGAFTVIKAMSQRNGDPAAASRPFDAGRDGFVMGEGAGMFLLERLEDACARGARIYGEVAGFGLTNDAHHMSAPRPDGTYVARAMQRALEDARVHRDEVEAINAHGSSTPLGDRTEALAYHTVFGDRAARIPVSATKGQHGHALGATGAWEVAVSLLSMRDGVIPGAVNFESGDGEYPLALTRSQTSARPRIVLSNSSGFGGINAVLVLKAF